MDCISTFPVSSSACDAALAPSLCPAKPARPVSRARLHQCCNLAWAAGDRNETFEQALEAVRKYLHREPDESVDLQLPGELKAAWERGVDSWWTLIGQYTMVCHACGTPIGPHDKITVAAWFKCGTPRDEDMVHYTCRSTIKRKGPAE